MTATGISTVEKDEGGKRKILATFILIRMNNPPEHHEEELLAKVFAGFGATPAEFLQFVAFIEKGAKGFREATRDVSCLPLPGYITRCSQEEVREVLDRKILHQSPTFRKQGQPSYRAPEFMNERTLVLVIGSAHYLADNLDLYLEHTGKLRRVLIDAFKEILDLQDCTKGRRKGEAYHSYARISVQDEAYYPGNLDALIEQVSRTKMRTEDLLRLVEQGR